MFRHKGKSRTLKHNLQLAACLAFVAGIVNVCGFFSLQILTTNVTGHFAHFADEAAKANYTAAWLSVAYVAAFFAGAFFSTMVTEVVSRRSGRLVYTVPIFIEITLLLFIALLNNRIVVLHAHVVACALLFAMGLQNALVTHVSSAVVRTTHLTGLFTDLGIELAQLFFYKKPEQKHRLTGAIKLHFTIVAFFFLGCITGGYVFSSWKIKTLLLAVICLIIAALYDGLKFGVVRLKRKYRRGAAMRPGRYLYSTRRPPQT
ncbi:MAG TPA: YoaK family protein [Chitinophaga sp.]|uniref:YoaK family protein n=1 Tax=Chitinophaga sp. TaxID=1869181 RepID=UPI002DBAA45F|nr:YoaK family protein [Chitinophaga sp.]HEU4554731.1 YoaK family protein [Chitinophaga sp.]